MFVKEFSSAKEPMVSPATAMRNSAGIMGADRGPSMNRICWKKLLTVVSDVTLQHYES